MFAIKPELQSLFTRSHHDFDRHNLNTEQTRLWSTLPPDYQNFLRYWNGGELGEDQLCFDVPIPFFAEDGKQTQDHQTNCVEDVYGFRADEQYGSSDLAQQKKENDASTFLPARIIAIARCIDNSLVCMSTGNEDQGAIYYWNYYWRYPWCLPFFAPRVRAAEQAFPDIVQIRSDPQHPLRQQAADALNLATLVRLADDLSGWLAACRTCSEA